jgi:hypothetical protein
MQAVVGAVQKEFPLLSPVIQDDRKTAGSGNYEFLTILMGVAPTFHARRHIVQIVDSPDWERDMPIPLNEGKVPSVVDDLRKIDDSSSFGRHLMVASFGARIRPVSAMPVILG